MAVRLKVGTYIIDAARSSSTSTTTGVRLATGEEGPGVRYSETRTTATITVPVIVERDSTANLKTSLDALLVAVIANANGDLTLESATGTTLRAWQVSATTYTRIEGSAEVDEHETNAVVLVTFNAERAGVASDGAGDPDGAVSPVIWNFSIDADGLGGCAADCVFESRAYAIAWVQSMRNSTNWPGWLGTHFRFATPIYQKEQQQNQASPVPETAYVPTAVSIIFNALKKVFAGNSAFDDVVSCEYDIAGTAREDLDQEAGESPGFDVLISGSIQFKTEIEDDYDSNDTSQTATTAMKAAVEACLDVIEQDAKDRSGLTWFRTRAPLLTPSSKGEVAFAIMAESGDTGKIRTWAETVVIRMTPRDRAIPGSKGTRIHPHRLGDEVRVSHSLAIEAYSAHQYKPLPFISSAWFRESWEPSKPRVMVPEGEGMPVKYVQSWSGTWLYLGETPKGIVEYEQAAVLN